MKKFGTISRPWGNLSRNCVIYIVWQLIRFIQHFRTYILTKMSDNESDEKKYVLRFISPKVKSLLKILETYKAFESTPECEFESNRLCGLIFTDRRATAQVLAWYLKVSLRIFILYCKTCKLTSILLFRTCLKTVRQIMDSYEQVLSLVRLALRLNLWSRVYMPENRQKPWTSNLNFLLIILDCFTVKLLLSFWC